MPTTKTAANGFSLTLINHVIVALSIAAFGSGMSMRVMDPMLVQLAFDFSVPLGMASWTITVFGVAYGFSQLLFGPLGDRYGKVKVVTFGCAACSLAALFCGATSDFSSLLLARAFAGATAASVIPLAMAWIGDVVDYDQRQAVLAKFLIGQILGLSSGVLIGGFSVDYLHWRFPFFVIAFWFAGIALYLGLISRRLPAVTQIIQLGEGVGFTRTFGEFKRIVHLSWARQVLLTVCLEGAAVFGALAFVPVHLHTVYNLSLFSSGALVMLFGLGGLTFAFTSRYWVARLGEVGLIRTGAFLMFASLVLLGWMPFWWWVIPACFLFGVGFYMMHNTLQINATQMAPERRGAAVAAFASCFFLGQSVGVAIVGMFITVAGTPALLSCSGLIVFAVGMRFSKLRGNRPT